MLRGVNNADLQRAWTPVRPETTFDAPDSDPDPELQMDIEYIVVGACPVPLLEAFLTSIC